MRKKDFDNFEESIREAGRIRRGEAKPSRLTEFAPVDVKAIRQRLGKSQAEFARMIGVGVATLQNWEQGRRRPEGPARALLKVPAVNPEGVAAALAS
jgi:putative transcriptional regulator